QGSRVDRRSSVFHHRSLSPHENTLKTYTLHDTYLIGTLKEWRPNESSPASLAVRRVHAPRRSAEADARERPLRSARGAGARLLQCQIRKADAAALRHPRRRMD